jgi:integration host factor subunit beta
MNKLELIDALGYETGLKKYEAKNIVDLFFDELSKALANGDRAEIRCLCSFSVNKYKRYTGRNPKTGQNCWQRKRGLCEGLIYLELNSQYMMQQW